MAYKTIISLIILRYALLCMCLSHKSSIKYIEPLGCYSKTTCFLCAAHRQVSALWPYRDGVRKELARVFFFLAHVKCIAMLCLRYYYIWNSKLKTINLETNVII